MTKIEKLISESGYRQDFISKKTGIAESTLSRYKKGLAMTARDARVLAEFFRVPVEDVIGYVEEKRRKLQFVA